MNKNPRVLHDKLTRLAETAGFLGAVVLDKNEDVVTSYFSKNVDEGAYGPNIAGIYKASQVSSLQMDIGGFLRGRLESPNGHIVMIEFEDLLFALIGDRNAKGDHLEAEMEKFVENTLYQ